MSENKKSFLKGAAILGLAGIICKIIGAFYRIPLTNLIGEEAMGIYSKAYPIYTFLLVFSTSGIPTAIAKMVAEYCAENDYRGARRVFKTSFFLLLAIGSVSTFIMLILSAPISSALGIGGWEPIAAIAPSLLLVSLLSAYRGYYQGMQNMTPTATTQLVEQIIKLAAGFALAAAWMSKGPLYAAAGALLGITISEFIAFVSIIFIFNRSRNKLDLQIRSSERRKQLNASTIRKRLLYIAIPITIGGAFMPLVDSIDSVMVTGLLKSISYSEAEINTLFGVLKGMVNSLINMPAVITVALAIGLVPAISAATKKQSRETRNISATGVKFALLIGLPCCIGFLTMSRPILSLLYSSRAESSLALGGELLSILSFGILFLSIVQTSTGILQGLGRIMIPIRNLGIGVIVKLVVNYTLVVIPSLNIRGLAFGTVACYAVAAVLDLIAVIKYSGITFKFNNLILRPVICSGVMLLSVILLKLLFANHLSSKLVTLVIIGIAAVVYILGLFVFNVFNKSDLALMPGGEKITQLIKKLGFKIRNSDSEETIYVPPTDRYRDRLG